MWGCSDHHSQDTLDTENNPETEKLLIEKLINDYGLTPVVSSRSKKIDNLKPIDVYELEKMLSVLCDRTEREIQPAANRSSLLKTRSEGPNNVRITGSESGWMNTSVSGTVYVDLVGPSVTNSSLAWGGAMDAFLYYEHMGGNASRNGEWITFSAWGKGHVKIIFEGITLFNFNTSMHGSVNRDGTCGTISSFGNTETY